jgi:hypothetical protein
MVDLQGKNMPIEFQFQEVTLVFMVTIDAQNVGFAVPYKLRSYDARPDGCAEEWQPRVLRTEVYSFATPCSTASALATAEAYITFLRRPQK